MIWSDNKEHLQEQMQSIGLSQKKKKKKNLKNSTLKKCIVFKSIVLLHHIGLYWTELVRNGPYRSPTNPTRVRCGTDE